MKKIAAIALLILQAALFFAQDDTPWFMGKTIVEIQFEGLRHADAKAVDAAVKPFLGKPYSTELWEELQVTVLRLEFFQDGYSATALPVPTNKDAIIIRFTVVELPFVSRIRIEGNAGLVVSDILGAIKVKVDDIYKPLALSKDLEAVRKLYRTKGYMSAEVKTRVEPQEDGSVVIVFECSEGSKAVVKRIGFTGLKTVSESALKAEMALKEIAFLQEGVFDPAKLEGDKQKILSVFQTRGYVNAKIVDVVRKDTFNEKEKRLEIDLTFSIDEGRQYYFGEYGFSGNAVFETAQIHALMTLQPGAIFNLKKFQADMSSLQELYFSNGYLMANIKPEVTTDEAKGVISVSFKIAEGERAHIEKIIIKGNKKTSDEVILRELPFEEGDIFSSAKIREGLRNLGNLQYFSDLGVEPEIGSRDNLAILTIIVEEQSTADIRFGGTLSGSQDPGAFPISGTIKWADINFFGTGRQFSVESNLSVDSQELIFSFADKWLFEQRISGGIDLTAKHQLLRSVPMDFIGPIFGDADQDAGIAVPDPYTTLDEYKAANYMVPAEYTMSYDQFSIQLGLTGGYAWSLPFAMLGVSGGYGIDLSTIWYDANVFRPFKKEVRNNRDVWLAANSVFAGAYLNALDLWYDPSDGWFASQRFTVKGFFVGEPQYFIKSETKAEAFATLFDLPVTEAWNWKAVIGGYSSLTVLMPQPGRPLTYSTDSLYLDGHFNARGWNLYGVDMAGSMLFDSWLELRMPIVPMVVSLDGFFEAAALINAEKGALNLAGTLNSSGNQTWDTSQLGLFQLDLSNFAFSVGFGVRMTIPQLPLRLYLTKRFCFDDSGNLLFGNGPIGGMDLVFSITQPLN